MNLQLQQSQVGVAIIRLFLALLGNVVLEDGGCLGIVSVETIQYGIDMLRAFRRIIEWDAHCEVVLGLVRD